MSERKQSPIGLPARMQAALEGYRKRVWMIKLAEGALAGLFGLVVSYLVVFGLDRWGNTPALVRAVILAVGSMGLVFGNTTAMALGFQVLLTARAAAEGASFEECIDVAKEARKHTGVVFAVDTLEFLHRGGRIGGASRYLGAALNLKPILEVVDGKIEAIDRVRTRKKSLTRLLELVDERVNGNAPLRLAALHANSPDDARFLLQAAVEKYNPVESVFSAVSPVIGTHAGPGTVAIAYCCGI